MKKPRRWVKVPINKSAAAIRELFDFGIAYTTIAGLAGIAVATVTNIKAGKFHFVRSSTEAKILAVRKIPSARRSKGRIISPAKAKKHLAELRRKGATHEMLAKVIGITTYTLKRILGGATRIFDSTERKILAVNLRTLQRHKYWNGRLLDPSEVLEHGHALFAAGVAKSELAKASGLSRQTMEGIFLGRRKRVRAQTGERILTTTRAATIGPNTLLPSKPFFHLIHDLRKRFGFSYAELSRRLDGYSLCRPIFKNRGIRFRSVIKIMRLHDELTRSAPKVIVRSRGRMKSSLYGL